MLRFRSLWLALSVALSLASCDFSLFFQGPPPPPPPIDSGEDLWTEVDRGNGRKDYLYNGVLQYSLTTTSQALEAGGNVQFIVRRNAAEIVENTEARYTDANGQLALIWTLNALDELLGASANGSPLAGPGGSVGADYGPTGELLAYSVEFSDEAGLSLLSWLTGAEAGSAPAPDRVTSLTLETRVPGASPDSPSLLAKRQNFVPAATPGQLAVSGGRQISYDGQGRTLESRIYTSQNLAAPGYAAGPAVTTTEYDAEGRLHRVSRFDPVGDPLAEETMAAPAAPGRVTLDFSVLGDLAPEVLHSLEFPRWTAVPEVAGLPWLDRATTETDYTLYVYEAQGTLETTLRTPYFPVTSTFTPPQPNEWGLAGPVSVSLTYDELNRPVTKTVTAPGGEALTTSVTYLPDRSLVDRVTLSGAVLGGFGPIELQGTYRSDNTPGEVALRVNGALTFTLRFDYANEPLETPIQPTFEPGMDLLAFGPALWAQVEGVEVQAVELLEGTARVLKGRYGIEYPAEVGGDTRIAVESLEEGALAETASYWIRHDEAGRVVAFEAFIGDAAEPEWTLAYAYAPVQEAAQVVIDQKRFDREGLLSVLGAVNGEELLFSLLARLGL